MKTLPFIEGGRCDLLSIVACAVVVLCASGCTSSPVAPPLDVKIPDRWQAAAPTGDIEALPSESAAEPPVPWAPDPVLRGLVQTALQASTPVQSAREALTQARLSKDLARHGLLPTPSVSGSISRQWDIGQGNVPDTTNRSATAAVSYTRDIDPSIANREARDATRQLQLAERSLVDERRNTALQLVERYWAIAAIDEKLPLARASTANAQALLAARQLLARTGSARNEDVQEATRTLLLTQDNEVSLLRDRQKAELDIAVLMGVVPQGFRVPSALLPSSLPGQINLDTPLAVLDRRSDVFKARMSLDEALWGVRIAEADKYPRLTLKSSLTSSSTTLRTLLDDPLAMIGLDVNLAFVDWRRVGLNVATAKSRLDSAAIGFKDSLLRALSEVEALLIDHQAQETLTNQTRRTFEDSKRHLEIQRLKLRTGGVARTAVLDAEQAQRDIELQLIDQRLTAWRTFLNTQKALGLPTAEALN